MNDRLLDEVLRHVPFDGWTERALASCADPDACAREFPGGISDVVREFNARADRAMIAAVQGLGEETRTRDRIAFAVRARLESLTPHREAARRLAAWAAMPGHQSLAARLVWRTVDAIWRAAGDRSTDFGFYTKRALLAGVYGATVLYWLEDRSPGSEETWRFLDRRILDVTRLAALRPAPIVRRGMRPAASRPWHRTAPAATPRKSPR
jgi:ubiquinone biosynthesis protein COQ9